MKRREFFAASCAAGLTPLALAAGAQGADEPAGKQVYELRFYRVAEGAKREAFLQFLGEAAIPAWNRIGVKPVGVFAGLEQDLGGLYVLLPFCCLEPVATADRRLLADEEFRAAGKAVLEAPKDDPAYERIESSLLLAFDGMPKLECPAKGDDRLFQLRIYESHSLERAKKKIDMFNLGGEIAVFHKAGLTPVFFGEALVGPKLPNLTYMVGFDNIEAKEKAWSAFIAHPEWKALKDDPQYKDTVSNITNIVLQPAGCSQI